MPQAQWQSSADGRYWIDVALASYDARVMIDLGLVDPFDRVAFEIDPGIFDALRRVGDVSDLEIRTRRDSSGRRTPLFTGALAAQLIDPISRLRVGPVVRVNAARGAAGIPNRVGVVFFHHLVGCHVNWHLDQRTWRIDYP
jgi:hypothetical protein